MSEAKTREGFLDALRFLAAISVVLFHYGFRGHVQGGFLAFGYPELSPFARYGYLGVELFFMISGYVILWTVSGRKVSDFAVNRFIRLYPTFWFCALLTLAAEHLMRASHFYPGAESAVANITMVPSWFGFNEIDGAYWSLAIELEFYILVGVAIALLGFKRLAEVLIAWLACGFILSHYGYPFAVPCGVYDMYFCFGGSIYLIHRDGPHFKLLALAGASFALCVKQAIDGSHYWASFYGTQFSPTVCASIVSIAALLVVSSKKLSSALSPAINRIALALGGLTYPLYLLHSNIGFSIMDAYFSRSDRWIALLISLGLVMMLATFVYYFFDRPVRAWLRAFLNSPRTRGLTASSFETSNPPSLNFRCSARSYLSRRSAR